MRNKGPPSNQSDCTICDKHFLSKLLAGVARSLETEGKLMCLSSYFEYIKLSLTNSILSFWLVTSAYMHSVY